MSYQLSHIRTLSSKIPGKFWSFKDTKHYKKAKYEDVCDIEVYRRFVFEKSYLLEVYDGFYNEIVYVVPLEFRSHGFPKGSYIGISSNKKTFGFTDKDILGVIYEN